MPKHTLAELDQDLETLIREEETCVRATISAWDRMGKTLTQIRRHFDMADSFDVHVKEHHAMSRVKANRLINIYKSFQKDSDLSERVVQEMLDDGIINYAKLSERLTQAFKAQAEEAKAQREQAESKAEKPKTEKPQPQPQAKARRAFSVAKLRNGVYAEVEHIRTEQDRLDAMDALMALVDELEQLNTDLYDDMEVA